VRYFKAIITGLMVLSMTGCFMVVEAPTLMPTLVSLPLQQTSTPMNSPVAVLTEETASPEISAGTEETSPLNALAGTALQTTLLPPVLSPTTVVSTTTSTNTVTTMPTSMLTPTPEVPIPLPIATILESTSVSADDNFYIAVSNSLDWTNSPAPEGQRWLILVATIANRSDHAQPVTRQQLRLVDSAGQRYLPETPDDSTIPPLVEITLKPGENVRGLVRYALPINAQAAALEWCLDAACNQRIESLIP
jgi:hypothetical protein